MPANRIVALLTPVIAVAAGGAATWLADNVGLDVSAGELQAVFIAGLLAVLAPAAQWLHGFQKFEAQQQVLDNGALAADERSAAVASAVDDDFDDDDAADDDDYDDYEDDEDGEDSEDEDLEDGYEAALEETAEPAPAPEPEPAAA
jgi:hypothetical protein